MAQTCQIIQDDYVTFDIFYCKKFSANALGSIVERGCKEIKKMKNKKQLGLAVLLALGLVFIIIVTANLLSKDENRELSKAVFYVA